MLNALNALSDETSLFKIGIFCNPFLLIAIAGSVSLHCMICYIPFFNGIFGTVPLSKNDWILVMLFSVPVIIIDEILKFIARIRTRNALKARLKKIDWVDLKEMNHFL